MTKRILITNDDGIEAAGIRALEQAAQALGEVWTVAPATEQSATGHSVSLHRALRMHAHGERRFAIDGSPTDCVFMAMGHVMPSPPDLIISGVNRGGNVAADVTYSGTVAAAFEGALRGVPSLAASRVSFEEGDYGPACEIAVHIGRQLMQRGLPRGVCLNLNVPPLPAEEILGVVAAPLGWRSYGGDVDQRTDPRGQPYHWIGGTQVTDENQPGSDCIEVKRGYATVTPITVDWTDGACLRDLADWELAPW